MNDRSTRVAASSTRATQVARDPGPRHDESLAAERLAVVVEVLPEGLIAYDHAGCIALANTSALRLLGVPPAEQLTGLRHSDLVALIAHRLDDGTDSAAALGPDVYSAAEAELQLVNPFCFLHLLRCDPPPRSGTFASLIVLQDRTWFHAADRLRRDELHVLAHDLRTPLTNVKAYTQLALRQLRRLSDACQAEDADAFERTIAHLETVERQAERVVGLANALSELASSSPGSGVERQ